MEYAHKVSKLKVGEYYLVAHAVCENVHHGYVWRVPVIPNKHKDLQFAVKYDHYHIDGRFNTSQAELQNFNIEKGYTNQIILAIEPDSLGQNYRFLRIEFKKRKCLRETTGIMPPKESVVFNEWYENFIGKVCFGKKCPHFGTKMIEANGKLYCPLHNLHADPLTLKVVNPY